MAVGQHAAPAAAADRITVRNPATGDVVGAASVVAPAEVAGVVERAREAQKGWEALGFEGRARVLRRAQKWTVENAQRIARTIQSETGKAWEDAEIAEVVYTAGAFGFWAKHAPEYLADEKIRSSSPFAVGRKLMVRYAPVGVVGVIGPWNYPLNNSFGDAIPALAAGNAVVLKPSEMTPLTSLLMLECMRESGLPEGVYQVVPGFGETGAALVDHVDMVMFTGSTATGRKVMERAARTLTPVSLELGGKDPMIVLADADLERAATAAVHYSMQNSGQTCISIERVYVEEPVYDEFVAKVSAKVRGLRQGVPGGPSSVDVGAITSPEQVNIVEGHIRQAEQAGARLVRSDAQPPAGGTWVKPTLLLDVMPDMDCMREETFGPTLPVMKVESADAAIRLANDSPYGLAASIWTRDVARGEQLAREVEAGVVSINDAQVHYAALELPMGGWKASGLGHRHGAGGIRKYCRQQAIVVVRLALRKEPHMLPYQPRGTKIFRAVMKAFYGRGKRD